MKKYIIIATAVLFNLSTQAKEEKVVGNTPPPLNTPSGVNCARSSSSAELDINNVRAFILNGGDMWWDQPGTGNARYEVPKVNDPDQLKKNSLFAGSVWIGGEDAATNQILVTAQTYRQSHYAYWPGPLVANDSVSPTNIPSISTEECSFWNKHFKVNRTTIDQFIEDQLNGAIVTASDIPDEIKNWPGRNNPFIDKTEGSSYSVDFNRDLAPFKDVSGPEGVADGDYNPLYGDYPEILGDQTIWWVMNDVGNQKEFGGNQEPLGGSNGGEIGIELETRAFAFQTNDAVNDMTFYEQKLTNKGSRTLINTYLGQWVDPDLGNYVDDYVGCDVTRGLGICYNGDDDDDGVIGYGLNPPAIGVDFFQGPLADLGDGIDNDRDGLVDEGSDGIDNNGNTLIDEDDEREKIVMSNFLYYNNNSEIINGNPSNKQTFYNYLRNIWGDGSYVMYDGADGTDQSAGLRANFMFPGTSDQEFGWGVGGSPSAPISTEPWDEVSAGNNPSDRRFLQSAGPFTLEPGQVNVVTIGVVWCRAGSGGATGSIACLKAADDLAQELFDRDFKDFNGPNPPNVSVTELDQEVVLSLTPSDFFIDGVQMNTENYIELDKSMEDDAEDPFYRFQGYIIYQLKDESVSSGDIDNTDLARIVAQCDIQDGASSLINYSAIEGFDGQVGVEMVEGEDNGVFHTISIKNDLFNSGSQITNNKEYYYMVIAYASNVDPYNIERKGDQYIGSKKDIQSVVAVPHKTGFTQDGIIPNSEYGTGIDITAVNGTGTGGVAVDYTSETVSEILKNGIDLEPTYLGGNAPISVKVYDPYNVKSGSFKVKLYSRILFDLERSDVFQIGDQIIGVDTNTNATINPSVFDYDSENGIGYIKDFVDTFNIKVDSTYSQIIPEKTEVIFNTGTRDTVYVISPADTIFVPADTIIDTTSTPPDTTITPASTQFVPADTVITTFNIDTVFQALDTVDVTVSLPKTVVEAKIVVTNNNFLNNYFNAERGTFAKHIAKVTETFDPDANNGNGGFRPIFQGYDVLPVNFETTDGRKGITYDYDLLDFFELEDENGNVLNYEKHYKVSENNEIIILKDGEEYGITMQMKPGNDPEFEKFDTKGNGFLEANLNVTSGADWLRIIERPEDLEEPFWLSLAPQDAGIVIEYNTPDPTGVFKRIASGSIAPYSASRIATRDGSTSASAGGAKYPIGASKYTLESLPNVDIVLDYNNPDNWTRVPVLQADFINPEERANPSYDFYNKSDVPSVGKDGNPDGTAISGLGWFPGYAIDLDRGVRLNMMFSESKIADPTNGNNLIWEPTSDENGGKSYIYVLGTTYDKNNPDKLGSKIDSIENAVGNIPSQFGPAYAKVFNDVAWIANFKKSPSQPVGAGNYKIRIRVNHHFRANKVDNPIPEYAFSTDKYLPTVGNQEHKESLCDDFRVVPNPYYAYSEYENGQLDNRVRLTNLPGTCRIKIYTLSGTLVRYFDKKDDKTYLDWNLLNEEGSNVASGTYLIHIEAEGICEKVVKFFGVIRPLDLDTF